LTSLGGQVYQVQAAELSAKLSGFLRERGIRRIQMWESIPQMTAAGMQAQGIAVQSAYAADLQAGVTSVLAGIAETSTLVIAGGLGQALSASLVPPIHIAILGADQILPSLEQALRLPEVAAAPATVLVSGPSRTADIEMTLTIGVHGPAELHVFVVDGSAGK
jgi:L-lactate dehydrogenase complex protein LldG